MLEGWEMGNVALEPQEREPVFARRGPNEEDDLDDEDLDEDLELEDEDDDDDDEGLEDDDDEDPDARLSAGFEDRNEDH